MEHHLQLPLMLKQQQQSQSASHSRKAMATLMLGEERSGFRNLCHASQRHGVDLPCLLETGL